MNRAQRRHPQEQKIPPVNIRYGHNGECVILMFDKHTNAIALTPEQVDAVIKLLLETKAGLLARQASNG